MHLKDHKSPKYGSLLAMDWNQKYSLKTWILIGICLQNAGYSLLRKYCVQTESVSSKEILLVSEFIKIIIAIYMTLTDDKENSSSEGSGIQKLIWLVMHSSKMLVLAGIYAAMNILSFVALQYIGAGEFTVCAQLKILTTASFSVIILGTSLSWAKWRALFLLVMGCLLVASPTFTTNISHEASSGTLKLFGFAAVLTEVVLSGFASIYFEKVVKSTTEVVTIWERNFQLGFYSILVYGVIIVYETQSKVTEITNEVDVLEGTHRTAWSNWTLLTLAVSVMGALGGLLVAATLKYADSILKTLAAAGAIVISTVLGHYLLSGPLDVVMVIGAVVTILSIANYTLDATAI